MSRAMYAERQQRVRVRRALEERIKGFRRREELWPLRVPPEPLLLEEIIERALPEGGRTLDPAALRSRTLLRLEWEDGSAWETWVTVLPSGFKVYCDSNQEEARVLASGGRNEGDDSDRAFLELLCESAGAHFGIEMSGGPPARVRSSIPDREFLVDCFVNLFEVTGAEESVRAALRQTGPRRADFRADVEQWLDNAARARRARSTE